MRRIILKLFSQMPDMHHQRILISVIKISPHRIAERVKSDDPSPVLRKLHEQGKFFGRQRCLLPVKPDGRPLRQHLALSQPDDRLFLLIFDMVGSFSGLPCTLSKSSFGRKGFVI